MCVRISRSPLCSLHSLLLLLLWQVQQVAPRELAATARLAQARRDQPLHEAPRRARSPVRTTNSSLLSFRSVNLVSALDDFYFSHSAPSSPLLSLCFRSLASPDRMIQAMSNYVKEALPNGKDFVECDAGKSFQDVLISSLDDATPYNPIFFILSPGADPVQVLPARTHMRTHAQRRDEPSLGAAAFLKPGIEILALVFLSLSSVCSLVPPLLSSPRLADGRARRADAGHVRPQVFARGPRSGTGPRRHAGTGLNCAGRAKQSSQRF